MSAATDKRRPPLRNDTRNQNPLQPTNASTGGAAAARMQGYSSPWVDGSGKVLSAMHDASGVRKNFINGLSPEDANTQRVRESLGGGANAGAGNPADTGLQSGGLTSTAGTALDRPTNASVALDRPTAASVALNPPAARPAAATVAPAPNLAAAGAYGPAVQQATTLPARTPSAAPAAPPASTETSKEMHDMMVQAARTEQASGAATNPMWQGFGPIGPRTPVGPGVGTDPGTPTTPGGPVTPTAKPAQGLTSGGNLDAATSTVPGGPTTPNARPAQGLTSGGSLDAATPTVAGGLTTPNATAAQGLTSGGLTSTAAGTLRTALSADDLLAKAPTANGPAPAQSTYNPVPRTPPAGGAPTDPASTPSDPSNGFSLGSYHPDKFTGDPAASTNPFATPQPLSLSTNGMFNGNFNLGGAPATPAGGNAQDPAAAAVDPDELLKRKAAMLAPAPVAPAPVAPVPNVPRGS